MRSSKHAKHAKPALHPTRSTLSAGLTAVLLPLCMATPALADGTPAPAGATTTSTVGSQPAPAPAPVPAKVATAVRISGPGGVVSPGRHRVAVRLLAGGQPVRDAYVRLDRFGADGWVYAGRVLTGSDGLGSLLVDAPRSMKVRAVYQGSATRTASTSPQLLISVAGFRQRAVQVASQQNGKPYRYGSVGPDSFDCSGLIKYAFARAGKSLPRTSGDMYRVAQKVSQSAKQPGDLIFMSSNGRIGHVGVYAGGGKFWDAPRAGKDVALRAIYDSGYYVGRIS